MVARGRSKAVDPSKAFEALSELSRALSYAVNHPTFDATGRLVYQVRAAGGRRARRYDHDPVSRPVRDVLCPGPQHGCWDRKAMVEVAALFLRLARYLYPRA